MKHLLIYITICLFFFVSCKVKTTDIGEYKKYGEFIDCYYDSWGIFNCGNRLVFKDSFDVVTEIKVTESVYRYFEKQIN